MKSIKNLLLCPAGRPLLLMMYALSSISIYAAASLYLGGKLGIYTVNYIIYGDCTPSQPHFDNDDYWNSEIESHENTKDFIASRNSDERVKLKSLTPQEIEDMRLYTLRRLKKQRAAYKKSGAEHKHKHNRNTFIETTTALLFPLAALLFHVYLYRRQRLPAQD